ncbi:FAD-dependent oxidoreductase [Leptolyngbya sp. FACHB-17]|uniref:FAD-dependent oxidoreductase n=1 Tax=unclassified Leptolyngbya TaxID=2650499 RepID=UPI0016805F63|nr:FAD-dependent oxidoreductase [Leptolyngbya sp. FACHB-17]MBD2081604.1 FAD-dependent oxidoreductase [Leptolyngbya sp. FACHB-17]
MKFFLRVGIGFSLFFPLSARLVEAATPRSIDQQVSCEILVVGAGTAGVAATYEALKAGRTVCLTEITDWMGGQVSAQGTSALDERATQRSQLFFPRGYTNFRQRILAQNRDRNPGACWVSLVCFMPKEGHEILRMMLGEAEKEGKGKLYFFPNTVAKSIETTGSQIQSIRAIQHRPAPNAAPLNTYPLSQTIVDSYTEQDSPLLQKKIIQFVPPASGKWYVIEATETGELVALTDVPYRLGLDARSYVNPSSSSETDYPYCPQGYTYTFAMEATATPQPATPPDFYPRYSQSYSFNDQRYAETPELVFTYRRIQSRIPGTGSRSVNPGDISMQNWNWGNDYAPGTSLDNYILSREQLRASGQLNPNGWLGGLRVDGLRGGEEQAIGFFHWFHSGTTDAKLSTKKPFPNLRYLTGFDSPMGTAHGLSKYPYMRESRRIIGRPAYGYAEGFAIDEVTASRKDFSEEYYQNLGDRTFRNLATAIAGLRTIDVIRGRIDPKTVKTLGRSHIYPDSVGTGHYPLDFHPCMVTSPPEKPGNQERQGERQGADETYPFQIPLRSMIPQKLDNMLVTGKSIAMSHIAAAAYRVHSIEWSAGAAAGTTATFSLETGIAPFQLVENLPNPSPNLEKLQQRLNANNNPTAFPGTSILNTNWQNWK